MFDTRVVPLAAVIACASSVARADPVPTDPQESADRVALAETLFRKAKALMAEHRYAEACPALAESLRLDSGGGTQLALALCHEHEGRTATAWAEFREALSRALQDGEQDRATVAKQHVDALEPRLSKLTLRLDAAAAATPGLSVRRDGIALGKPSWDLSAPVDPGDHDIEVSAPGRRTWTTLVRVGQDADLVQIVVPPLEVLPPPPNEPLVLAAPAETAPPGPPTRRVAAISLAGIGAASLGIGIGFGVLALDKQSSSRAVCPTSLCNDAGALQANRTARAAAWVADIAIPAGAAASVASIVLFAIRPKPENAHTAWTVTVSPTRGVEGRLRVTF
jgi:hypothetical protein